MKKLILGLFIVAIISNPQLSAEFKEEREGLEAAFGKVVGVSNSVVSTALKIKEEFDKGMAYKEEIGSEASKYYGEFKSIANGVNGVAEAAGVNPGAIPIKNVAEKGGSASSE